MAKNWKELILLLRSALKKDGIEIIRAIMDRIYQIHNLPASSKTIKRIEDLTEVKSMLEANTKNWEKAVYDKGIDKGINKGINKGIDIGINKGIKIGIEKRDIEVTERMAENGISNNDIRKITGLPLNKIIQIRKRMNLRSK